MLTCKTFHIIGRESLFRSILTMSSHLPQLCAIYTSEPTLGHKTQRLHLRSAPAERGTSPSLSNLESLLAKCTRLETVVVDGQLSRGAFKRIADALCSYNRKSLHALSVCIPMDALPTFIAALRTLPRLTNVSVTFYRSTAARAPRLSVTSSIEDDVPLGAVHDRVFVLRNLSQLVLRGPCAQLVEQAAGWDLPSLRTLSIDPGAERENTPDVLAFLHEHGETLRHLELAGPDPVTLATALDLCPLLHTLVFNPDWKLALVDEDDLRTPVALIAHHPHPSLVRIGLASLLDAFGVAAGPGGAPDVLGPGGARLPTPAQLQIGARRRANDALMRAITKEDFPNLKVVRAVDRTLLSQLERMNGPGDDEGCFERWEWWWDHCARMAVRLEDCTGNLLGTLPPKEADEEGSEEGSEEYSGSEEDSEGDSESDDGKEGGISDLRQLLEECRQMSATRDLDTTVTDMFMQMGSLR